jgi:hypothetical protein
MPEQPAEAPAEECKVSGAEADEADRKDRRETGGTGILEIGNDLKRNCVYIRKRMPKKTKSQKKNPTMQELEDEIIRKRRDEMIHRLCASNKKMKYIGQLTREQLEDSPFKDYLPDLDSKLNGNETSVQYLMFEVGGSLPVITQLRLTAPPEMRRIVNDLKSMGL